MTDKQPMQADGDAAGSEADAKTPDGVNSAHGDGDSPGAYPNGVEPDRTAGGFFGHGGQTHQAYSGPDDAKANATTE